MRNDFVIGVALTVLFTAVFVFLLLGIPICIRMFKYVFQELLDVDGEVRWAVQVASFGSD